MIRLNISWTQCGNSDKPQDCLTILGTKATIFTATLHFSPICLITLWWKNAEKQKIVNENLRRPLNWLYRRKITNFDLFSIQYTYAKHHGWFTLLFNPNKMYFLLQRYSRTSITWRKCHSPINRCCTILSQGNEDTSTGWTAVNRIWNCFMKMYYGIDQKSKMNSCCKLLNAESTRSLGLGWRLPQRSGWVECLSACRMQSVRGNGGRKDCSYYWFIESK